MTIDPTPTVMPCKGCGIRVLHKMCIAHGTEVYCNPQHPAFGDKEAIEQLKTKSKEQE